ncbi:hypothetical protein HZA97_04020 [Candidatus Woesearchaeota archaeon]|nr:hypothetical protein [Candidatus Woesearchaeota archaeon]
MSDTVVIEAKEKETHKTEQDKTKNKRKNLEDFLKEKSTITFEDKVWNVKKNLKQAKVIFPAASLTTLGAGISSAYFGGYQLMTATLISLGAVGTALSLPFIPEYVSGKVWKDHLSKKKEFGKNVQKDLPGLLDSLDHNPNREAIYDFLHAIKDQVKEPKWLLDAISIINLKDVLEKKYEQLFKVMTESPEKYANPSEMNDAINHFNSAEKEKEWEETTRLLGLRSQKKGLFEYFDLSNTQKIYLILLSDGWEPQNITQALERMPKGGHRKFFLEYLLKSEHKEKFFLDLISVYGNFWKFRDDKKLDIMKYLFDKKDKLLVSRLKNAGSFHRLDSKIVLEYLSDLDKLPGVGIKGQINTILKLGEAINVVEGQNKYSYDTQRRTMDNFNRALENLLTVDYSSVDESIIGVIQFLKRHPNINFDEIFPKVFKYYMFTQGRTFKSDWMKKEVHKLPLEKPEEQPRPEVEGLLDARGERKFLEELDRKVELARFEAFNRAIEDVYYAPLDDLFNKKANRTIRVDEEILNVITYFNDSRCIFKEELENLLKIYFEDPSKVQEHIDNLPGNKALEGKVKGVQEWKKGLSKTYDVSVSEKLKEKLEEESQSEYSSFLRCIEQLEAKIAVPREANLVKKAEAVFEMISKIQIPEDKQYLVIEAKHHLTKLKSKVGILEMNSQQITFYDSKNPIERMNMGVVSHSCTDITGGANDFASVANTIDNNKKVIYISADKKVGRTLAILTDKGIVTYRKYDSTNLATDDAWVEYFQTYARQVGVPLIVPRRFVTEGIEKALKARGAKSRIVRPTLQRAVCDQWYDDHAGERVRVNDSGYTFTFSAYVLR